MLDMKQTNTILCAIEQMARACPDTTVCVQVGMAFAPMIMATSRCGAIFWRAGDGNSSARVLRRDLQLAMAGCQDMTWAVTPMSQRDKGRHIDKPGDRVGTPS